MIIQINQANKMVEKSQWHVATADEVIAVNDSIEMTSDEQNIDYNQCPVHHEWVTPVNGVHVPYV